MSDMRAALCGMKRDSTNKTRKCQKSSSLRLFARDQNLILGSDFIPVRILQLGRQKGWRVFRQMAEESIFYESVPMRIRRAHPSHRAEASPRRSAGIRLWMPRASPDIFQP